MSSLHDLPERVFRLIETGVVSNFATVSKAGMPIDNPTYYFPSDDMKTLDVATSLANPAKAERARRNPKVGLGIEGSAVEPVVIVNGRAAVRDSNLQKNCERYIAETGFKGIGATLTWEQARQSITYWTRMIIEVTPSRVMWWDNPAAMDGPPQIWSAPANTVYPESDPAPKGAVTPAMFEPRPWREPAESAVARKPGAHLTLLDKDGWPISIQARKYELVENGFRLTMPRGVPWLGTGKGCLTFEGAETFVGEAVQESGTMLFKVERSLPESTGLKDNKGVLQPPEELRRIRMARTEAEVARRGQSIPNVPEVLPKLTRMGKLRQQRIASDVPILGLTKARGNRNAQLE
jgi:hypothetical protein